MSKALSLKLDDRLFEETESLLRKVRVPRNAYINQAVALFNRLQKRRLVKKRLRQDARLLQEETKRFIRDFELLEDLSE